MTGAPTVVVVATRELRVAVVTLALAASSPCRSRLRSR